MRPTVVIFLAALSLVRGVPSPLLNRSRSYIQVAVPGVDPAETCGKYCDVKMGSIDTVLRVGEKVASPDDPCVTYTCIGNDQLRPETLACDVIDVCPGGFAPYRLPGECCLSCSYLESSP